LRAEELGSAAGAAIDAGLEDVVVLAAERPLGSLLAEDVELLRRQLAPPLLLGLSHLRWHRVLSFDSSVQCRKERLRYAGERVRHSFPPVDRSFQTDARAKPARPEIGAAKSAPQAPVWASS